MNASASFDALYATYYPKVLKLCLGYTGDYPQAQDLAQETFIKVWENLSRFRGDAQLSTWLYRIAVNTCLYHLRAAKARPTTELTERHAEHLADEPHEPESALGTLYRCISQLPETDRLIIGLVLEDTPYADIAQIIGLSEGNLRVRIHRIKKQLSTLYARYGRV
ncbi:sigma-70 family RNA polymerase sigma factor [Rhabdobacter roseus]|uniref:RNA polymerase sigma factor n=1 Tax=Rhabdobacter roseus TaxID=1655419 RepID=A0A840TYT3_9BACT|nr:RNA polymerase sigma factor [Rhabdobacter roseus]MBB5286772.1 RNA polymerase sigma-70 factor (ECF subfamily) [Rhabdobacter roseus]